MLTKFENLLNRRSDEFADTIVEPDVTVDPSVVQALRARLNDSEVKIRRNAARGLGILRGGAAIPELVTVLREDRDDDVRFEAAQALRKIGDPSVGDRIVPMLNFNNDKVRNEIIATLGALRYSPAVPELTRAFEVAKPSERSRTLALSALADIGDVQSEPLFQSLKADKDDVIRLYATEGLARTADPDQKTALSAARLVERSSRVQNAQAFGLLRMGHVEYLDELIRGLGSAGTRDLSREYLLETPSSMRPTLFAKRPDNPNVRAELADVFGWMGDRSALPALLEMEGDPDPDVSRAAEQAHRRINATRPSE